MLTATRSWQSQCGATEPVSTAAPVLRDGHVRPILQTDAKIVFQCGFDVVWCTQYRAPVLVGQIKDRLPPVIAEVVEEKEARLAALEICPAYVRLSVEVSPNLGIHRLVKAIKSRSAHVLRSEFPSLRKRLPSMWTNSYLVTTVGVGAPSTMIEQFLNEQKTR